MLEADEAPGWDALTGALSAAVGGVEPFHTSIGFTLPDTGVYALSGYRLDGHWLVVTYGMSELFAKVSDDPSVSGFGYELTMRVPDDGTGQPPSWVFHLLKGIGDQTYRTGQGYRAGSRVELGRTLLDRTAGAFAALAFTSDPLLQQFDGPRGRVEFLTAYGITANELAAMKESRTETVLIPLRDRDPRLVTDPHRLD